MMRAERRVFLSALVLCGVLVSGVRVRAERDGGELRGFLEQAVEEKQVAGGSVLVIHRGEVVFGEGFGYADVATKRAFRLETPVVVASISKPLLGTTAFRLAEKEALDLSVPISEYLPEFEGRKLESGVLLKRAPTTLELFTHISGLRESEAKGGRPWYASWTEGRPLGEVVKRYAAEFRFKAQPGSRYAYSGIGSDVAARVLEVAGDQPRNVLLVEELAKPLGMLQTFYRDVASLKLVKGPMPTRYYLDKDGKLQVSKRKLFPPANTYTSSGGSIISTAPDLARWLMMIRNGGRHEEGVFLEPAALKKMLGPAPRGKNASGGLFIREKNDAGEGIVYGHSGSSGTNCWIDLENDVIGIMLTQTRGKDIKPFRIGLEKRVRAWALEAP